MYKGCDTFFCELVSPLTRRLSYRRYSDKTQCPEHFIHDAQKFLRDEEFAYIVDNRGNELMPELFDEEKRTPSEKWPTKCDHCDFLFGIDDRFQIFQELLFRRVDTGLLITQRNIGPGGLYYDPFMGKYHGGMGSFGPGPDGQYLIAVCPNGRAWNIDSRASNCTMPDDNTHKCWVRHGDPRTEKVHVDKNGKTCNAGGGSIVAGDYHGFLHNGRFTDHC